MTDTTRFGWRTGDVVWSPSSRLVKYSDDQPRDDHGRWTDGGGSGAASGEKVDGFLHASLPSGDSEAEQNQASQQAKAEVGRMLSDNMKSSTDAIAAAGNVDARAFLGDKDVILYTYARDGTLHYGRTVSADQWAADHPDTHVDPAWGNLSTDTGGKPVPFLGSESEFAANPQDAVDREVGTWMRADDPKADGLVRDTGVRNLLTAWAASSNDTSSTSLAIQDTAEKVFGGQAAPWPMNDMTRGEVDAKLAANGPVYEDLVRTQYAATQTQLASAGIKSVDLTRGMIVDDRDGPTWAKQIPADGSATLTDTQLRPLSSWSADPTTAARFAGVSGGANNLVTPGSGATPLLLTSTVPADRILSTPRSGFGCLSESEFVVINGPGTVTAADMTNKFLAVQPRPVIRGAVIIGDEDWIKRLSWDLPTTLDGLTSAGLDPAKVLALDAGVAAPASLKKARRKARKARRKAAQAVLGIIPAPEK